MDNPKEPGKKKVKDEDLSTVSGGCGKKPTPHEPEKNITVMKCSECKYSTKWSGKYVNGIAYQCPRCGSISFFGDRLVRR